MSSTGSPQRKSNSKHKGVLTSLQDPPLNGSQHQYNSSYMQQSSTSYAEQPRVYVQTTYNSREPNVLPYIDKSYEQNMSSFAVNEASSQYVPSINQIGEVNDGKGISSYYQNGNTVVNERQNNHIKIHNTAQNQRGSSVNVHQNESVMNSRLQPHQQSHSPEGHSLGKSKFVPAPPETFLVNNNRTFSTVINSPSVITQGQSIKKTYVPHHIYNEIPVFATPENNTQSQNQPQVNDESQEVLMQYYEKVYKKYHEEKQHNYQLSNEIAELKRQLQQNNSVPNMTVERVFVDKRKRIDAARLEAALKEQISARVDAVVNTRKASCLNRLNNLFNDGGEKLRQLVVFREEKQLVQSHFSGISVMGKV